MDVCIFSPHYWLLLLVFSCTFTIQIRIHGAFQIHDKASPSCSSRSLLSESIALTPPMGWNSWNHFQCNIDEKIIKDTADALISTGLSAVGFTYVNIDDCWGEWNRDENGNIVARRSTFPSGIKAIADYVHKRGLMLGIYSDAGNRTCSNTMPGSLGHEDQDAFTFSQWGVDYLKYDNCYSNGLQPRTRFEAMSKALAKVGRPIFYAICEWGQDDPAKWAGSLGNAWRTTGDINDSWASFTSIADANNEVAQYAGVGGWNDPDMLEVGNGGMTLNEYRSHFSIWCLMKAPLLIGCDIRNVSSEILTILLNKEVVAVNQDPLGIQGQKLRTTNDLEVWAGKLSKGRVAVVLWNRSLSGAQISVGWKDLGVPSQTPINVRDLWEHSWVQVAGSALTSYVDPHSCKMYIITPTRMDV